MSAELPAGYTWRRATLTDVDAVAELLAEHNTAVVGFADSSASEVRDDLTEPGFVLDEDSWLVFDPAGVLVGFGWAFNHGNGRLVDVDAVTVDSSVAPWLSERVFDRAVAMATTGGHQEVTVDRGVYRADERTRELVRAAGFEPATVFHRMRIDHDGPVPPPRVPPGLTVRTGPGDEAFLRQAHAVLTESFQGHYGHVDRTFQEWREALESSAAFSWPQLAVAELDGRPVAALRATDEFVDDQDCGYVAAIGVLPAARGRGIGRYLLRRAFAEDAARGRAGTILHVDTNNVTPALGLYTSVGMRPVLVIDMWRRVLALTPAAAEQPVG